MTGRKKYKLGFWGSPPIAAGLLELLSSSPRFSIEFALTQPDKARSARGRQVLPSAVKKAALEKGIEVISPSSLKKEQGLEDQLAAFGCDFFLVIAYGKIIPEKLFSIPRRGSVNFHASLLPLLRGAAPIEYSLLQGLDETGWSLQKINNTLDAGDVCFQNHVKIDYSETRDSLYHKLSKRLYEDAENALLDFLEKPDFKPQDDSLATFCGKFTAADRLINWNKSAIEIRNLGRAFSEKPGVYSKFNGKKVNIVFDYSMAVEKFMKPDPKPSTGTVAAIKGEHIFIQASDLALPVLKLQPEGKKLMNANDFVNGYRIQPGQRFDQ